MSDTIWKFPLQIADRQTVKLPGQCRVLSVAEQHGQLCMWVQLNPDNPLYDYTVAICGTGHEAPEEDANNYWSFIGTVLTLRGDLVWHVFVLTELDLPS